MSIKIKKSNSINNLYYVNKQPVKVTNGNKTDVYLSQEQEDALLDYVNCENKIIK